MVPTRRTPARWRLVLVLPVLVGVLAMHGLVASAGVGTAATHAAAPVCGAADDHDGGDHSQHAETSCKASGVATNPVPSAALAATDSYAADDRATPEPAPAAALATRDPPTLSELQLLRI